MRLLGRCIAALLLSQASVVAAEETPLLGAGIDRLLRGATVRGSGWTQTFHADGRTLYERGGAPQWGRWRVDATRYCSQWPPNPAWSCYDMARDIDGDAVLLIWTTPEGHRSQALLQPRTRQ